MYLWLKGLHILLACSSVGLLGWRLWRARQGLPGLCGAARAGVHLLDSLLLLSALLLIRLGMPWPLPLWLQFKIACLLGYILASHWALRTDTGARGPTTLLAAALLGAVLVLALDKPWW